MVAIVYIKIYIKMFYCSYYYTELCQFGVIQHC